MVIAAAAAGVVLATRGSDDDGDGLPTDRVDAELEALSDDIADDDDRDIIHCPFDVKAVLATAAEVVANDDLIDAMNDDDDVTGQVRVDRESGMTMLACASAFDGAISSVFVGGVGDGDGDLEAWVGWAGSSDVVDAELILTEGDELLGGHFYRGTWASGDEADDESHETETSDDRSDTPADDPDDDMVVWSDGTVAMVYSASTEDETFSADVRQEATAAILPDVVGQLSGR